MSGHSRGGCSSRLQRAYRHLGWCWPSQSLFGDEPALPLYSYADGYVRAEAVGAVMLTLVSPTDPLAGSQELPQEERGAGWATPVAGGESLGEQQAVGMLAAVAGLYCPAI
jgi:hypothetical protein